MAPGTVDHLHELGLHRDAIHYIPNGADTADFQPSKPRHILRERYKFTKFTAVYTDAHGPANGLFTLLDAAEKLRDSSVDIALVGNGVEKERIQREAAKRRLTNLRFFEPMPKKEMPDLLNAADLGLHILADAPLFRTAASPNKLFDYTASGLPVLTNSIGVVGDWVEAADAGWCVPSRMLSEQLRTLSRMDTEQLRKHGTFAREWIEENQSRTAMANRLGPPSHQYLQAPDQCLEIAVGPSIDKVDRRSRVAPGLEL